MGISLTRQLYAIVYACLCGVSLGCLYDVFRLIRAFFGVSEYTRIGRDFYSLRLPLIGTVPRPASRKLYRAVRFWAIFASDVLFAFLAGCIFSTFLYVAASGCFRWFYLLSACVGFSVYYFTIGYLVITFSDLLICLVRICIRYIVYFLLLPLRFAYKLVCVLTQCIKLWAIIPIAKTMYVRRCRRYTVQIKNNLSEQIQV